MNISIYTFDRTLDDFRFSSKLEPDSTLEVDNQAFIKVKLDYSDNLNQVLNAVDVIRSKNQDVIKLQDVREKYNSLDPKLNKLISLIPNAYLSCILFGTENVAFHFSDISKSFTLSYNPDRNELYLLKGSFCSEVFSTISIFLDKEAIETENAYIWVLDNTLRTFLRNSDSYYMNLLTEEMNFYLTDNIKSTKSMYFIGTYIFLEDELRLGEVQQFAIRFPGATRGSISIDEKNKISDIKLFDDEYHTDSIYKSGVREIFKKYIGMSFIVERVKF